ncbi:hypothetical protein Ciccas_002822 [Cichlidogyrus casuarinus]|uniref:Uncharacterized protein n=1 Tax=Cichlidogyrus casuarinus TaxID=1844966 RepID=A0ABD2QG53_9PLAT
MKVYKNTITVPPSSERTRSRSSNALRSYPGSRKTSSNSYNGYTHEHVIKHVLSPQPSSNGLRKTKLKASESFTGTSVRAHEIPPNRRG